jgi:ABC-type nitrate/sulfonate/bicarbonate transport system substrate-binding protein
MSADTLTTVRVIAFPGAPNLPTFAADAQGFFAREGLKLEFAVTPSSVFQAEQLAAGNFDIAFTAFDNVVAYSEGQGAAKIEGDPGFCVIAGATQLELAFVVAPDVQTFDDLNNRSIALDAVNTGFAFVLYDMLEKHGIDAKSYPFAAVGATPQRWQSVKAGEHVGTITIEPFTAMASNEGFKPLARSTDIYETYQGGIIASRRDWVAANPETVKAFIRAYLAGLDWTLDPANREAAEALLLAKMDAIKPQAAKPVMKSLLSERSGLTPDAAILEDGMKKVLELRSRYGGGASFTDIERYLELGPYKAVIAAR